MEHVISDECLSSIRRTCYEAGASGREVYTSRGPDGPEVVRCRDCFFSDGGGELCNFFGVGCDGAVLVDHDGFCSWGERRDR